MCTCVAADGSRNGLRPSVRPHALHERPPRRGTDARNRRRVPHRDILRRRVRFRTAVPLRDAELEALITDTFRLQYLKGPSG